MARARNIKPSFFTDDELAEIAPLGRLLFQGLWCHADREGRLEERLKKIKAEILPYDNCNVERLLQDLHEARFIVRYEHDGRRYIQVRQFKKHQNPHMKEPPSTIPAQGSPPTEHGASTVQAPDNNDASTRRVEEIPERARRIPDSGFPLSSTGLRIADSPSPPPDPGLPQPAAPPQRRAALAVNGGTATSKPIEKDRTSKANGHGDRSAENAAHQAVFALGKQLNILPEKNEVFTEYEARVIAGGKAAGAAA